MNILSAQRSDRQVLQRGFVESTVWTPVLKIHVEHVLSGMKLITENPDFRKLLPWQVHSEDQYGKGYEQEVGLKYKDDDERKWTFQYTSAAYSSRSLPSELHDFLGSLFDLEEHACRMARDVSHSFDRGAYGYPGSLEDRLRKIRCVTRVLRYPKGPYKTMRAKPHIDRSMWTVHWYATHAGLRLHTPQGEWVPVEELSLSHAAVFPGEKFAAATRGLLGLGTPHGVWCEESLAEDRYAIVSFVHPEAQTDDCAWLKENAARISAFEKGLKF